jgi:hypothetical protein
MRIEKLKLIEGNRYYTEEFPEAESWNQAMRMKVNQIIEKINEIIEALREAKEE